MLQRFVLLNLVYPILCILYLVSMHFSPYPGQPLFKSLPVFLLFLVTYGYSYSISHFPRKGVVVFALGFLFSSFGDLALAMDFSQSFLVGLGLFFIAHVLYIVAFSHFPKVHWKARKNFLLIPIFLSLGVALFVLPNSGELVIPVTLYILVITIMACMSLLQKTNLLAFFLGAIVFMASDAMIAIHKFVTPIPYSSTWIMATYYIAQGLFARGLFYSHEN